MNAFDAIRKRSAVCRVMVFATAVAWIGMSVVFVRAAGPVKRARPPKFSKAVTDAFFPDARQKLVGARPKKALRGSASTATRGTPSAAAVAGGASAQNWSQLISPEVIEDEIKAQHQMLGDVVKNVVQFKGGDYRRARGHLSVLAAMFAIDAQYGQQIRWQREAAAMRDLLARAGFNSKVGSDASYQEAKARFDDLETLVRGGSVDLLPAKDSVSWQQVADRGPLMSRLEQAHEQSLTPWTASANEFSRNLDLIAHEAQLVAALADVIQRDGYEYADDDTYREYAQSMRTQALVVRDAASAEDYERARQAVEEIGKACTNCHEGYRN
jgi:hypothetical protein